MAFKILELPKWGPPKLREIIELIQNAINERAPKVGLGGIAIDENPDGAMISFETPGDSAGGGDSSTTGGGATVNVYGARNGAPAVFHLQQSSAPTAP